MDGKLLKWALAVFASAITAMVGLGTLHSYYVLPGIMSAVRAVVRDSILVHQEHMVHARSVTEVEFEARMEALDSKTDQMQDDIREIRDVFKEQFTSGKGK